MTPRILKFRAWDEQQGMVYDFKNTERTAELNENGVLIRSCWQTLMQFTGKLGFNDRELYEGDIIFYEEAKEDGSGDERYYLVIVWIPEWSMFASLHIDEYLKFVEHGTEDLDETMFWTYTLEESQHYHYAGNIYQNPELLTKQNEQI